MSKRRFDRFLTTFCWLLCFSTTASIEAQTTNLDVHASRARALVGSSWLARQLHQSKPDSPELRVLEIGEFKQYELGHLPHAAFVDWIQDITDPRWPDRYNVLPRQPMEQLLRRLGIEKQTTVVLYDQLENRLATRMFWTLRYYGHQNVKILDGGKSAWVSDGLGLVTDVPIFRRTHYSIDAVAIASQADCRFIRARLAQPKFVLIDGRPREQFSGRFPGIVYHTGKPHARRGHLPQAVNIPWKKNLTAAGKFKPVGELRNIYAQAGVSDDATVVTYCNEGLHAAHPWFVLTELLGYERVRVYDDSLSEWANTSDKPLVVDADAER